MRNQYLASFTSRGTAPHATHSPTNCSARSLDAHDSYRSSCRHDARASADCMSNTELVSAHPDAGAGGDCHGGGVKLLFLVRHPLLYSKSFLGACRREWMRASYAHPIPPFILIIPVNSSIHRIDHRLHQAGSRNHRHSGLHRSLGRALCNRAGRRSA